MAKLTHEKLLEVLHYDPVSGVLTWKGNRGTNQTKGRVAGWIRKDGYRYLTVSKERFLAHRLIWFYMTGEWPENQVDHKDRCRSNNKWENLREATYSQNGANSAVRKDSISGIKGVAFHPQSGRWKARITSGSKPHYLGIFKTPDLAHQAYISAARKYHGEFSSEG